ncbi:MAG: hypothetical protein FWG72_09785 [Oscillospiraceae bacterium]|nr:hypothetical protein [Oscillospiraceae bacterium]
MVFLRKDRVGLAFTVERSRTGDSFLRADAEEYALRELEKAGIPASRVMIEAFENRAGWLVFCTVECKKDVSVYIRFDAPDDFLDAVSVLGTDGVRLRGWEICGGYTVRVSGPRERVAAYITLLSEYGNPFEAPPGYARHLDEQAS